MGRRFESSPGRLELGTMSTHIETLKDLQKLFKLVSPLRIKSGPALICYYDKCRKDPSDDFFNVVMTVGNGKEIYGFHNFCFERFLFDEYI